MILRKLSAALIILLAFTGCTKKTHNKNSEIQSSQEKNNHNAGEELQFKDFLDSYSPQKKEYNFFLTYKLAHSWWDAVALGIEDAVNQYEEKGVFITYDYVAPDAMSAYDQTERIKQAAATHSYDVIGVDVADIDIVTPVINQIIDDGQKVMTFSSSDSSKEDGCKRIAYVGNTHNYRDGKDLAEVLCEKLEFKGKVAMLIGNVGAPCHEDRASGAREVFAKYPDIELVEEQYDEDIVEKAYDFTKDFIEKYPDLNGIICCNMSNSVGAGQAVEEARLSGKGEQIIIVGMDHDQRALAYLRDGIIYALALQDCYAIGFDTITTAVKIADGILPGSLYPEKTEEKTEIYYQNEASDLLSALYGIID